MEKQQPQVTRLTVQHPHATTSQSSALPWIVGIIALAIGSASGFFTQKYLDDKGEYERYAAELAPLIYYKDRVHAGKVRGSNETMRLVNFRIYQADQDGLDVSKVLSMAQPPSEQPPTLAKLNNSRFLSNLELGKQYGIYEGKNNLKALAFGKAPEITKGEYTGERIDVEHVVPKAIAPSLDNILANLMWLPAPLNQSKSDTITKEAMEMAQIFHDEGILPLDEFVAVKEAFKADQSR